MMHVVCGCGSVIRERVRVCLGGVGKGDESNSSQECRHTKGATKQLFSGSLVHRGTQRECMSYFRRTGSGLCMI